MAETTITPTLPRDIVAGMIIRINVPTAAHRTDFDCEVLEARKTKRNEQTCYAITIIEPLIFGQSGRSTRYFMPRDRVQVVG